MRHPDLKFVREDAERISVHSKYTTTDGERNSTRHIGDLISTSPMRWLFSAKTKAAPMAVFDLSDLLQITHKLSLLNSGWEN